MNKKWRKTKISAVTLLFIASVLAACGGKENTDTNFKQRGSGNMNEETNQTNSELSKIAFKDLGSSFSKKQFKEIYLQFSPEFKNQVSEQDFINLSEQFRSSKDKFELASHMKLNGIELGVWLNEDGTKALQASSEQKNIFSGMTVQYFEPSSKEDKELTKTVFQSPFEEDQFVFWGGNHEYLNYHYAYSNQKYAYDFIQVKSEMSFDGDSVVNESYYAFGQPILAPADGTVVLAVDHIADNSPVGVMNEKEPAGNVVVIDHGNGEFSYLAHLQKKSVVVKEGEQVKQGAVVGKLGNSGNSSEPHLHFHVANGKDLNTSQSLQIQWANGEYPVRGETMRGIQQNK